MNTTNGFSDRKSSLPTPRRIRPQATSRRDRIAAPQRSHTNAAKASSSLRTHLTFRRHKCRPHCCCRPRTAPFPALHQTAAHSRTPIGVRQQTSILPPHEAVRKSQEGRVMPTLFLNTTTNNVNRIRNVYACESPERRSATRAPIDLLH